MLTKSQIIKALKDECERQDLDPILMQAIMEHESSYIAKKVKFERGFIWYYKVNDYAQLYGITQESEQYFQKFSWGLFQVMGGSAREFFTGFMTDLLDEVTNIRVGCAYFKKHCEVFQYVNDQIVSYNEGPGFKKVNGAYNPEGQAYLHAVLAAVKRITAQEQAIAMVN